MPLCGFQFATGEFMAGDPDDTWCIHDPDLDLDLLLSMRNQVADLDEEDCAEILEERLKFLKHDTESDEFIQVLHRVADFLCLLSRYPDKLWVVFGKDPRACPVVIGPRARVVALDTTSPALAPRLQEPPELVCSARA